MISQHHFTPQALQLADSALQVMQCAAHLLLHMQNLAVFGDALDLVVCHGPQQGGFAGAIASN